jgi:uncharacterized cupredoxin-like copper-binding protein
MTKNRLGMLALVVVTAALTWALPAVAQTHATSAATVGVTAGLPSEFKFKLSKASVPKGTVTFLVTNRGNLPHDFKIGGKKTALIQGGKSVKLTVVFKKAGKYPYLCTVSGHAVAGMKGVLTVK